MPQRLRSRSRTGNPGYLTRTGPAGGLWTSVPQLVVEEIKDNPPGRFQPLTINRGESSGGEVNGVSGNRSWTAYVPWTLADPMHVYHDHLAIPGNPTNAAAATQLLAQTTPNRPEVDIPAFVGELKDFPQLFKIAGDSLLKKSASANLNYQFGWRPLIGDLEKLLDFSKFCSDREKELRNLFQSGLRRKRQLFRGSDSSRSAHITDSNASISIWHQGTKVTSLVVRGYVEWVPTQLPPRTDDAMRQLARKAALGLYANPSAAWELLPWSWLIDWCTNVGDFLTYKRNLIGCVPRNLVIMRQYTTCSQYSPLTSLPGVTMSDAVVKRTTKTREPSSPTLSAQLPWLSLRQISILGSIGLLSGSSGRSLKI